MTDIFRKLLKNRLVRRLVEDAVWRVRLSLAAAVSLNVIYVLTMVATGIFLRVYWFYALAAYYLMLIIIRLFLLKNTADTIPGKNRLKEFYRYRFCGILMLVMNVALAVLVYYVINLGVVIRCSYVYAVIMTCYTFSAVIWASVNLFRYRRYESPLLSAAKAISLVSATVSLISLEASVNGAFVINYDPEKRILMMTVTGITVCAVVLGVALYMIIRADIQIKRLRKDEDLYES